MIRVKRQRELVEEELSHSPQDVPCEDNYNESEEFFYQLEGDIIVTIQEDGKAIEVPIKEGDIFLLPPKIPHNPIRFKNTIGLVMERKRREGEMDGLMWFCEKCNTKLYEEKFVLNDIASQFQGVFAKFYNSSLFLVIFEEKLIVVFLNDTFF